MHLQPDGGTLIEPYNLSLFLQIETTLLGWFSVSGPATTPPYSPTLEEKVGLLFAHSHTHTQLYWADFLRTRPWFSWLWVSECHTVQCRSNYIMCILHLTTHKNKVNVKLSIFFYAHKGRVNEYISLLFYFYNFDTTLMIFESIKRIKSVLVPCGVQWHELIWSMYTLTN